MGFKFDTLLKTEQTRKEFLLYIGILLLGLIGISGLIRRFNSSLRKPVTSGYGSTTYGGK